jgi:VIT1/CCC1 family predicted Fe2+/Mn2+ transporter
LVINYSYPVDEIETVYSFLKPKQMHHEHHVTSSETIRDIVIGMSDGLTVPFALAAGLSGAISSSTLVVTAGIAEIVAGSIAMGLGGYLAGRTEVDHYQSELKREYEEVEKLPEQEKAEVMEVFAGFGLSEPLQRQIADELAKDKKQWVEFMMRYELGLEEPNANRATKSAITIGAILHHWRHYTLISIYYY